MSNIFDNLDLVTIIQLTKVCRRFQDFLNQRVIHQHKSLDIKLKKDDDTTQIQIKGTLQVIGKHAENI